MNLEESTRKVVKYLSLIIFAARQELEGERHHPGGDPDRMDDRIKSLKGRIEILDQMRSQFEREMSTPTY